ncbi:hypothetical protein [Mycobacterium marinum]|uniref:hypothetical protein n=1 Tax=Mycobacterium marinum TaxID=1781 RepID=UPI00115CAC81|nr:hypothetical protein [Mycobacterium marinum]
MTSVFGKLRNNSAAVSNTSDESTPTWTGDAAPAGGDGYSPADQLSPMPRPDVEPDTWAPWNLIPLGTLALELNATVDDLARQLGDDEIVLDDIGLRCCTRTSGHALIVQKNARDQAQRDREARMRADLAARSTVPQMRARLKARAAEQEDMHRALGASGVPLHEAALAVATEADRTKRTRKTRTNLEEQLSGGMIYHSVKEVENE